ncbi:hypothetical protein OHC33_010436 [Knufia fluminis]|uniref:FAD-binding domain-containing protein n=1 Tax=Knufia fluminis TaxID=191047 RepID=A0AAN8EFP6_9EURO|nr:hypothetical protein OHC33_010436 [Knufia fluminis]
MELANGTNGKSPSKLKIIIVGSGIAGLSTAIALRQQGHFVELHDQSEDRQTVKVATTHLPPNCAGLLEGLGVDPRESESGAVPLAQLRLFNSQNELVITENLQKTESRWQDPWLLANTAHLCNQLLQRAVAKDGPGTPVRIHNSSRVPACDPENATITLDGSSQRSADVIVVADSLHFKYGNTVLPGRPTAIGSPNGVFCFIVSRQQLLDNSETQRLITASRSLDVWCGVDQTLALCPTPNDQELQCVIICKSELSSNVLNGCRPSVSKKQLLAIFTDYAPVLSKLINESCPDTLTPSPESDTGALPSFVIQKMALVGNSAHAISPSITQIAQREAQPLEDAVSLGIMLESGVKPAEVPERLALYNQARYERSMKSRNISYLSSDENRAVGRGQAAVLQTLKTLEHSLSHNETNASAQVLRQHKWKTARFWRQPTAFGPFPGPRQDAWGRSYKDDLQRTTTVKATIKFKTSATMLRNIFPSSAYAFEKPDTIATAAFVVESFKNLAWLGGGGYDLLALYIYGVQYTPGDGNAVVNGKYCPVMFENLADPIISGREELGVPKVFSDIAVTTTEASYQAEISWRGHKWATLKWSALQNCHHVSADQDLLLHKYMPRTGAHGPEADAEYTVLIRGDPRASAVMSMRNSASDSHVKFCETTPLHLPTLHHIVSRLAELPVIEVAEATVVQYQGVPDLSNAQRLS